MRGFSLRERREDIPPLVLHFVEVFSRRMGKRIEQMPQTTMNAFIAHRWSANVRELQNLVERAVIRSDNGVLPNPLPRSEDEPTTAFPASRCMDSQRALISKALAAKEEEADAATFPAGTFVDSQRALIVKALAATDWVIGGPQGAAARLGLKRSTLISKMKKLGIYRPRHRRVMDEFNRESELTM